MSNHRSQERLPRFDNDEKMTAASIDQEQNGLIARLTDRPQEFIDAGNRFAVDLLDDIAALQPGLFGDAAGLNIAENNSHRLR